MILITFIIFMIVIYALYKIYNDSETTFKPLDPNYNSEEMNKYINDVKDFVSEKVSVPKSVIDNMKAAENEEANKAKKILSDIPKKRKVKYKRENRKILTTEYADDFVNSNVVDVLYTPSVYLASEILEKFNTKNEVIEEPVYNHYEEDINRQAERASAVEDSYSYSGFGSGGGGGSSSDWSDSGSSSSYDSGSSDSGGSDD
jgi:hypothetical protein